MSTVTVPMDAGTPVNLTAALGVSATGWWDVQNRTPSWVFLADIATGDTPTVDEVAAGYAVQSNEHYIAPSAYPSTTGNPPVSLTDFDLWVVARRNGHLVAGDA